MRDIKCCKTEPILLYLVTMTTHQSICDNWMGEEYIRNISIEEVGEFVKHDGSVWGLCWNPTCKILASCGQDKIIRLWKYESDSFVLSDELRGAHEKTIRNVAFSPCGRLLAAASFDSKVSIWSLQKDASWSCIAFIEGHENEVKDVCWSSNGKLLASCGRDKTIWIWHLLTDDDRIDEKYLESKDDIDFECLAVLTEHQQDIKAVRFHPTNSNILISCSYDDTIRIWRTDDPDQGDWVCSQVLREQHGTIWSIDFCFQGKVLVSASGDGSISAYWNDNELASFLFTKWTLEKEGHTRPVISISSRLNRKTENDDDSASMDFFATAGEDRKVRIWTIGREPGSLIEPIASYAESSRLSINKVCWCPIDDLIAIGGEQGLVRILRIHGLFTK